MQEHYQELRAENMGLAIGSVDPLEDAQELVTELGLSFPLGWGLVAAVTAELLGCFFEEEKSYLHATGFLLGPAGDVVTACYSTGPVGRLWPANALALARHYKSQA